MKNYINNAGYACPAERQKVGERLFATLENVACVSMSVRSKCYSRATFFIHSQEGIMKKMVGELRVCLERGLVVYQEGTFWKSPDKSLQLLEEALRAEKIDPIRATFSEANIDDKFIE